MKILMLTTKFPLDTESPYLTNDICSAFISSGHTVTVVNIDWSNDNKKEYKSSQINLTVYNIPKPEFKWLPLFIRVSATWAVSSLIAYVKINRELRKHNFDACILTTPMTIFAFFLLLSRKLRKANWIAMCWDFFPIHQIKLGLIPKKMYSPLHFIEETIYSKCSRICVLSEDYKSFLKMNYQVKSDTDIVSTGLWGGDLETTNFDIPKLDLFETIVYGGQLIEGRGLDNFLKLCEIAHTISPELRILVIGGGKLLPRLKALCDERNINNIIFLNYLSRARYIALIQNCLAGLISLDKSTNCPSFPSKIVDYMRAGLPVIAMDDLNHSLQSFIERYDVGYYIPSNDDKALAESIANLLFNKKLRSQLSTNSLNCYINQFNPRIASDLILKGL